MLFDFENISNDHMIIVVVGYVIVFFSLFLLWVVFHNLPRLLKLRGRLMKFLSSRQKEAETSEGKDMHGSTITGEETAAISAAIFLFIGEMHDQENAVLTIEKISRRYSPWNSKIYNVINGLNKRF
jgi:glutaconyl-CoA/methylmalonyl-CoA decarboxylase subunit delta